MGVGITEIECRKRDFPGRPVVENSKLPLQGVQRVPSLVLELRSCIPRGAAKSRKKKKMEEAVKEFTGQDIRGIV